MSERIHVRVALDGSSPSRELIVDGVKVADLSYVETLEAAMQFVSSLRYEPRHEPRAAAG